MLKNNFTGKDVTIVICAYRECKYLEESIRSVIAQSEKTNVVISTSTPNDFIYRLADKYELKVWVNKDGGHAKDYNFAINETKTPICIMAHQDDLLHRDFVKKSLDAINHSKKPIIAFTNYKELHNDKIDEKDSIMVIIKRIMLQPLRIKWLRGTRFGKWFFQCVGDPITHPSVTYIKSEMPKDCFRGQYKSAMDWDLWERLSKQKGEFIYVNDILFFHRMHNETATAKLIEGSDNRYNEDFELLCRFWPKWIARFIMVFYSKAAKFY